MHLKTQKIIENDGNNYQSAKKVDSSCQVNFESDPYRTGYTNMKMNSE